MERLPRRPQEPYEIACDLRFLWALCTGDTEKTDRAFILCLMGVHLTHMMFSDRKSFNNVTIIKFTANSHNFKRDRAAIPRLHLA